MAHVVNPAFEDPDWDDPVGQSAEAVQRLRRNETDTRRGDDREMHDQGGLPDRDQPPQPAKALAAFEPESSREGRSSRSG